MPESTASSDRTGAHHPQPLPSEAPDFLEMVMGDLLARARMPDGETPWADPNFPDT